VYSINLLTQKMATSTVTLDLNVNLIQAIEKAHFQLKMKGLKSGQRVTKKDFYAFLLSSGLEHYEPSELDQFVAKLKKEKEKA
jgi:acyl-coenzyme A thioesterase PaaI-like protein